MQQDENQQANFEGEQNQNGGGHSGGAAPEHRQCQYIKADGKGCRDWAVRGHELCYRHGVFLRGGQGIDVPLLEDEASIVLVLSETLRAVAHGTIPLNNGRLLMDGCRLAYTMQMERQKAANAERARRRTEVREESEAGSRKQEAGSQEEEPEAESWKQEAGSQKANQECGARCSAPGAPPSEPCALSSEPWVDRFDPRYEEREGVLAAQAERLDERMEEELAVGVR